MIVSLDGQRIPLALGRWDASRAVECHMVDPIQRSLVELVEQSGLERAAEILELDIETLKERLDEAREAVESSRKLAREDLPILDMVYSLGYSEKTVADILGMTLSELRKRYWRARGQLRTKRHDEHLAEVIPNFCRRDFLAFEMHAVLNYSIGRIAKILGLNRGHLVRRINNIRELLRAHCQADTPSN